MSGEEVREKVYEIVREWTGTDAPITDESRLELDLGLDSIDRVELIMNIEDALGIGIDDEDADKMKTVGDVVKAAQEAVEEKEGGGR